MLTAKDLTADDRASLNGSVAKVLDKSVCNREDLLVAVREQVKARLSSQAVGLIGHVMSRILIVEDNEMNRDMLSRRLERRGYQVILAIDGRRGLAAARSEAPDLILMDMSLPEIDGWEVTRQLKSDDTTRRIPVIALTAHAMIERPSEGARGRLRRLRHQAGGVSAAADEDSDDAAGARQPNDDVH